MNLPHFLSLAAGEAALSDWVRIEIAAPQILTVFSLVFLNGFFVASEFAIVKVRDSQIASLAVQGTKRIKIARYVIAHLDAYLLFRIEPVGEHELAHSEEELRLLLAESEKAKTLTALGARISARAGR